MVEAARAEVTELAKAIRARAPKVWVGEGDDRKEVDALEFARVKLRMPALRRMIQRGESGALFDLELDDGTLIPIGTIDDLDNPVKVRRVIAERMGPPAPPRYTKAKWDPIFDALLAISDVLDSGTTPDEITRAWLAEYLNERPTPTRDLSDPEDRREAASRADITGAVDPFWADGMLHVYLADFERFLRLQRRAAVSFRELSARLERLGFESFEVRDRHEERGQKRARRRYKRSQPGFELDG